MEHSLVLNGTLIGTEWEHSFCTEWNTHWYRMGTLIGTEWEDKEETEPGRRIKNPWKRDGEGWE